MKKPSIIIFILLFSINFAFSFEHPEDFIKDGVGIRPLGMGGAFTAVSDDLNAAFYNPAGLDSIDSFNYVFGNLDPNRELTNVNINSSFNLGNLCFSRIYREDAAENYIENNYYSFGERGAYGFSYGLTYKNIRWFEPSSEGVAYSSDLGIIARITPDFSMGLLLQDFASSKQLEIPSTSRIGLAYSLLDKNLLFTFDVENGRTDPGNHTYYGLEWRTSDVFSMRGGSYRGHATIGFGIDSPIGGINYAAMYDKDLSEGVIHSIGISLGIVEKSERPFSIIRKSEFALIEIGGTLTGGIGEFSFLGGGKMGTDMIIAHIREATKDPYIDGIILRIWSFEGGLGSLGIVQDIRKELEKAKKKGKVIVAYIESSALGEEYYLASVADYVVAPPNASVGGLGKSISIVRIKGLLEKIGVEAQILSKGKYKTTFSMYEDGLTKEQKKMTSILVSDLHRQLVNGVKADRKIETKAMEKAAEGGILSASKAKEAGFIDEIGYFKDAVKSGAKLLDKEEEPLIVRRQNLFLRDEDDYLIMYPNRIAVIEINGDIVIGKSGQNILFGGVSTGSETVTEQIRRATDDWNIRAILIRINSGGGSAIASNQIYSELMRAREKGKIIVASLGDVAASGGYYIASAADHIVANPGTITGSIGVIGGGKLVMKELFEKIGIKVETVKEGKHADMFSTSRKLTSEEVESLSELMEETYQNFISAVAKGRGLTTAEVADVAEGKIYTGSQAKDLQLVDTLGNFSDAVKKTAELADIGGEPKLIYYREENFWLGFGMGAVKALGLENGLFPRIDGELTEYRMK